MNSNELQQLKVTDVALAFLVALQIGTNVPAVADTPVSKPLSQSSDSKKHPPTIVTIDTLIAQQKFDEAIALLNEELRKDPNNLLCLARRGAIHNQIGKFKQCTEDLNRAFALTHDGRELDAAAGYMIMRAYANYRLGNKEAARADIDKVGKWQPNTGQHYHIKALIEEKWGSSQKALSLYEKSLSLDPSNDNCLNHANALATKLKAVAQQQKMLEDCVRKHPSSHNLIARAQLNATRGRWKAVIDDSSRVIKLDAKPAVGVYQLLCQALTNLERPQEVMATSASGLKLYPTDFDLKYYQANALLLLGKHSEAIEICNELKKKQPNSAQPYEFMGHIYKMQKRYEQSAEEFRKAAKIAEPQSPIVLNERATAYKYGENYKEAAFDFERIFSMEHKAEHALRAGECYIGLSDYKSALKALNLALDPKVKIPMQLRERAHAYTQKALCYSRLNDPLNARLAASQALVISPKSAAALHFHAESSTILKDYESAIKDYSEMIRLQPSFARNYGERAKLYKMTGKYVLAQRDLNMVAKLSSMVEDETFPKKIPGQKTP